MPMKHFVRYDTEYNDIPNGILEFRPLSLKIACNSSQRYSGGGLVYQIVRP